MSWQQPGLHQGKLLLSVAGDLYGSSLFPDVVAVKEIREIPVMTIDDLVATGTIGQGLDVQGYELTVLEGERRSIEKCPPSSWNFRFIASLEQRDSFMKRYPGWQNANSDHMRL